LGNVDLSTKAICFYTGYHRSTVLRWQTRDSVSDLTRTGRPLIYSECNRLRLIGFYCQALPECGGRWTTRTAGKFLELNHEDIGSMSKSTINRILLAHHLKPHRKRYFLNVTDPDFFPKMELLIDLFLNRPDNLFAFDESPGIQILQRLVPDLQSEEVKLILEEFEYIRNGTLDIFMCLNVNNGKMFCECRKDHCTKTLIEFLEAHFEQVSKTEPLHYVTDNLNTHCSYDICKIVAKHSNIECPAEEELDNMEKRRSWLSGSDKRIVFHFTPFHGSWLNPAEIAIGLIVSKCLQVSYTTYEGLKTAIMDAVEFRNTYMAQPFRWNYKGEDLHDKVVRRFTQNLNKGGAENTELRILTKQLLLMTNLINDYRDKVLDSTWEAFKLAFKNSEESIQEKIHLEQGPKRKPKAQAAIKTLKEEIAEKLQVSGKAV